jgi:phosphohistidine phosphatase
MTGIRYHGTPQDEVPMQLLVIRHARAQDRETFAGTKEPDSERPLTAKGIRRMKKAARGLRSLVPSIGLLASSPLRRATETARIIADVYGGIRIVERDELAPGAAVGELIEWLASRRADDPACIVGHEPDLSELLATLLADRSEQPAKLKKGSATLVKFAGPVAKSKGRLQWYRSAGDLAG